jgi:hypothetical protein
MKHPVGRICLAVTQSLLAGDAAEAVSLLKTLFRIRDI